VISEESQANLDFVRAGFEQFEATGRFAAEGVTPEFVWDMSNFHGWPEQQSYEGVDGAEMFVREWAATWDDWAVEVEALRDAGDMVVALVHQYGRSKAAGLPIDMHFAMVFTFRDGGQTRMDMYSEPREAFEAVGLAD
jgi:ketosteroid isomerase-like protein